MPYTALPLVTRSLRSSCDERGSRRGSAPSSRPLTEQTTTTQAWTLITFSHFTSRAASYGASCPCRAGDSAFPGAKAGGSKSALMIGSLTRESLYRCGTFSLIYFKPVLAKTDGHDKPGWRSQPALGRWQPNDDNTPDLSKSSPAIDRGWRARSESKDWQWLY